MPPNQFGNQGNNNSQFDVLRRRAKREANVQTQQGQEALKRRFASIGQLNSGAAIKQQQIAHQQGAERAERATQNIDLAEAQENQRRKELIEGRQFQSGEAAKQREFITGERLGGQEFAGNQAQLGREFATSERLGGQEFAGGEAQKQRDFQQGLADREFQSQMQQNFFNNSATMLNLAESLGFNPSEWRHGGDITQRNAFFQQLTGAGGMLEGMGFDRDGTPIIS